MKYAQSQGYLQDQRRGSTKMNGSPIAMDRYSSNDSHGNVRMVAKDLRTERPQKGERRDKTSASAGRTYGVDRKTERVQQVPSQHQIPVKDWPLRRQVDATSHRRGHEEIGQNLVSRRLVDDAHGRPVIRRQNATKPEWEDRGFTKYHNRSRRDSFDSVSSFTENNPARRQPYQYRRYDESVTTDSMISFDERRQQRMDIHQRQQSYDEDIERGLRRFGFKTTIERPYDEETEDSFCGRSQFTSPSYCNESVRSFDSRGRTDLRTYDVDSERSFDSETQRQYEDQGRASTYLDDDSYQYSVQDSYNPRAFNTRFDTMSRRSVETQTELSELESTRGGLRRRRPSYEEIRDERPTYDGRNDRYRDDKSYLTLGTKLRDDNSEISRDELSRDELSEPRSPYRGRYPETNSRLSVEEDTRSLYTASRDDRSEVSWRQPYERSVASESDYRRPVSATESDLTERAPRFSNRSRGSERELQEETRGRNTKRAHSQERGKRDHSERQTWCKREQARTRDWDT